MAVSRFSGAVVLLIFLGLVSLCGSALVSSFRAGAVDAEAAVVQQETMLASLQDRITAFEARPSREADLSGLAMSAEDAGAAAVQLQSVVIGRLRELDVLPSAFGPAELSLPATTNMVAVSVEFDAGLRESLQFLQSLMEERPPIGLDALSIRQLGIGSVPNDTPVSMRIVAWAFWLPTTVPEE